MMSDSLASQSSDELMGQAVELDSDAHVSQVAHGTPYLGEVSSVLSYGVFVQLTEHTGSNVSGLVHKTDLPPFCQPRDFSPGDRMVVALDEHREDGDLSFSGLYSPDVEASGLTLADVRDVFRDVLTELHHLRERVDELESELETERGSGTGAGPVADGLATDGSGEPSGESVTDVLTADTGDKDD